MTINELLKRNSSLNLINPIKTKLIGRELETEFLEEVFLKKRMNNAILLGKAGVGKTAIVENFAKDYKDNYIVVELSMSQALCRTQYRGQFEEKITKAIKDIIEFNKQPDVKKVIVFIDEIHTIYGTGTCDGGIDAGNILKPYLSKNQISLIGATTINEYNRTIKLDSALARRLTPIIINELDEKLVLKVLQNFSEKKVPADILQYIYKSSLVFKNYTNPDISIEILDNCMAKNKRTQKEINIEMVDNIINYMKIQEI